MAFGKTKWYRAQDRNRFVRISGHFSDFLESFSGIVEIVKAADQQYGGLAYGTLSVFLSVAVRKDSERKQSKMRSKS